MTMTGRRPEQDITIKFSDVNLIIDYSNMINDKLRFFTQREQEFMKRNYHIDHLTEAVSNLTNEVFGELFEMETLFDTATERAEKQVEA